MPFEFQLAELLRCTVAELRGRISQREFMHWSRYLAVKAQNEEMEIARAEARSRGR